MQPTQLAEKTNVSSADLRRAAWTCSLGSALEYYDFALYSLTSAIIFGPLFFLIRNREWRLSPVLVLTFSGLPSDR